jgi:hypothetical protein
MAQIFWNHLGDGSFNTGADWSGGVVPGPNDDAILGAQSKLYAVTAGFGGNVNSIQLDTEAALHIAGGIFTATNGTGGGVDDGTIIVEDNATFTIGGAFDNAGIMFVDGAATGAVLSVSNTVTLSGGGIVALSDSAGNGIKAFTPGAVLENVDNNINGSGRIGQGGLVLFNDSGGVIDATGANGLLLNTDGGLVTNAGLIEATAGSGLVILGTTVDGSTGGTILADNNSFVTLVNADIVGGTLSTVGTGLMETSDLGTQLDGTTSAVHNTGTFVVDNGAALTIQGAIANTGAIKLDGGGGFTELVVGPAGATLSGGGLVTLSDNSANYIEGYSPGGGLTNIDNIISGAGHIGAGDGTLVNEANGVILGNGVNGLTIDTGANTVVNAGLIEANGAGGITIVSPLDNTSTGAIAALAGNLALEGSVVNAGLIESAGAGVVTIVGATVDDTGGGVILAGAGTTVRLQGADIEGGTVESSGTGQVRTVSANNLLDGVAQAVTIVGRLIVANNTNLTVEGAIHNTGKINLRGQAKFTDLIIGTAGATLTGGDRWT